MSSAKRVTVFVFPGGRYEARTPEGRSLRLDIPTREGLSGPEPEVPEASGPGPSPMEALLASLAVCAAHDVQSIMAKRRTPLFSYRIEMTGERADATPARYTRITARHVASGEGVNAEQFDRAVHLSHEKYCSVGGSLREDIQLDLQAVVE
ncbi:MAG TPA: OsmC family protein [Deinococcales bacterium]|nr:OsmC family protein [Deinococcales bacterium]